MLPLTVNGCAWFFSCCWDKVPCGGGVVQKLYVKMVYDGPTPEIIVVSCGRLPQCQELHKAGGVAEAENDTGSFILRHLSPFYTILASFTEKGDTHPDSFPSPSFKVDEGK